MWEQLTPADIERAKAQAATLRRETLNRHAEELRSLDADDAEIENLKNDSENGYVWGPIGRFLSNRRTSEDGIQTRTRFEPAGPYPEAVTSLLRAGLFNSSADHLDYERFLLIKRVFDVFVGQVRRQIGVW